MCPIFFWQACRSNRGSITPLAHFPVGTAPRQWHAIAHGGGTPARLRSPQARSQTFPDASHRQFANALLSRINAALCGSGALQLSEAFAEVDQEDELSLRYTTHFQSASHVIPYDTVDTATPQPARRRDATARGLAANFAASRKLW